MIEARPFSRVQAVRACWRTLKQMRDDKFDGDRDEWFAEMIGRLNAPSGELGEVDWEVLIDMIMEILPIIITLIMMFL